MPLYVEQKVQLLVATSICESPGLEIKICAMWISFQRCDVQKQFNMFWKVLGEHNSTVHKCFKPGLHICRKDRKLMLENMFFKFSRHCLVSVSL